MARGGSSFRGGRRGGGGPKGPAGLDWDIKYENISWKPEKKWPVEEIALTLKKSVRRPAPAPIDPRERSESERFRRFRDQVRESPIYTVKGRPKVHKPDSAFDRRDNNLTFMPLEYARTHSAKYYRPKRIVPRLDTRPYVLKYIPPELWHLLGSERASQKISEEHAQAQKKKLAIARENWQSRLQAAADEENLPDELAEDAQEDQDARDSQNEEAQAEDEMEALEEDESEDDDYNAEQYFNNGEDEDFGDDGGGDNGDFGDD